MRRYVSRWHFEAADTRIQTIPGEWLQERDRRFRDATTALFGVSHAYRDHLQTSMESVEFAHVSYSDCLAAAQQSNLSVWTAEQKARHYLQQWRCLEHSPLGFCFRSAGRVYYPLCNQPKALRQKFVRFNWNGQSVPSAEVDLSSSYPVFLLTMLPPTDDVRRMKRDIEAGVFYERLAEACTSQKWSDRSKLKVDVQIQCFFGGAGFGGQPLFGAMRQLYPTAAKFIEGIRFNKSGQLRRTGARELSGLFTKAEGAFFIDSVLPQLCASGIPTLTIHDAVIVPAPVAEQVQGYVSAIAENELGIVANFKIT
ncbi:MAG: hypothetical protein ABGZ35_06120 [Planctomycetaceae bacterium]